MHDPQSFGAITDLNGIFGGRFIQLHPKMQFYPWQPKNLSFHFGPICNFVDYGLIFLASVWLVLKLFNLQPKNLDAKLGPNYVFTDVSRNPMENPTALIIKIYLVAEVDLIFVVNVISV